MLFPYPVEAADERWFHECFTAMVRGAHELVREGRSLPDWPGIVPAGLRAELEPYTSLRDALETYAAALADLTDAEHEAVLTAVDEQNRIHEVLAGHCRCALCAALPETLRKPSVHLATKAFSLLTPLGIRDRQYAAICQGIKHRVCPFCGVETFDAAERKREDLDHYLARSIYPFAGVNPRNLVFMGMRCNRKYKHDRDLLLAPDGSRTRALDPYGLDVASVSLDASAPFEGTGNRPRWVVDLMPKDDRVETWARVFDIRDRYAYDVLDDHFSGWISMFGSTAAVLEGGPPVDRETLIGSLDTYIRIRECEPFLNRGFLEAAMFRMLRRHCFDGDDEVVQFLLEAVNLGRPRA